MITTSTGRKYINYRRRQLIARRICFMLSVLICSTILAFGASIMVTNAKTISNDTYYKYFTSVQVEEGDTLYSLAEEYGDYFESDKAFINEVKYANHLIEDTIYSGSYLVVPYYSTEYR